ncbi:MAG: PhoU domain-containing protein, partial [Verrucomicrobiota bacterium]
EALQGHGLVEQLAAQDLDGHVAVDRELHAPVHRAHAALTQLGVDAEAILEKQWELCRQLLSDACDAFGNRDADGGVAIRSSKSEVRKLASKARDTVSAAVTKNNSLAGSFVSAVNAIHALENIGLHACGLGEAIIFIETSHDVRDKRNRDD